jgi:hypothetical protein
MPKLEDIKTSELMVELINRGDADTDNEGQYIIYTGMYEEGETE